MLGICGNLLSWFKSFLTGRRQRVKIEGSLSDWLVTSSGIAHDSVLGPLLLLIYIQDLQTNDLGATTNTSTSIPSDTIEELRMMVLKFVDNTNVLGSVKSE